MVLDLEELILVPVDIVQELEISKALDSEKTFVEELVQRVTFK
jgi:hypothetical protein